MAPAVALAQQDNAAKDATLHDQHQPEGAQEKTKAAEGQTTKTTEAAKTEEEVKLKSVPGGRGLGISILGNQEAPKALEIVPWKGSELGNALDLSRMLDDSRLPIDKEVFMRMLSYYEIRSEPARSNGVAGERNVSVDTTSNGRKK
jgi:hypothetical protein